MNFNYTQNIFLDERLSTLMFHIIFVKMKNGKLWTFIKCNSPIVHHKDTIIPQLANV